MGKPFCYQKSGELGGVAVIEDDKELATVRLQALNGVGKACREQPQITLAHVVDEHRAVVHGSTFAKNDLAMAAGIATLEVVEAEKLVEAAAKRGAEIRLALTRMVPGYELLKEVRGKGLMIGVEFGPPKSLRLKASWNVLESANKGLFCQLITVPLFKDHKILTQVSGHGSHTIKLLPSLTITEEDCNWIEKAFDDVIASSHKVPGAIWSLGKTLVDNAVRKSA